MLQDIEAFRVFLGCKGMMFCPNSQAFAMFLYESACFLYELCSFADEYNLEPKILP